jgi:hypothetical protein
MAERNVNAERFLHTSSGMARNDRMRSAGRCTTLLVALCGCLRSSGQAPVPLAAPAVAVERDTYRVERVGDGLQLTIVSTFTNRTADTIVLHPCFERRQAVVLEKWVGGEWILAFEQFCPDIDHSASAPRLAPGESRRDTTLVFASLRPNTIPRFELETVPGLYRMAYWKAHESGGGRARLGALLPKELRVSNAFRVIE